MSDDSKRAWIVCYEHRTARGNVLCRGVHPLEWLGRQDGRAVTLLWYAETKPERAEDLRRRTRVEIAEVQG